MVEMRRCLEIVIEKGENECIFCGEKIISGCLWSIGAVDKYICVGDCCKTNLIKMYKDIIQDSIESGMGNLNYEEMAIHGKSKLEIFEKNILDDIDLVIEKEIEREDCIIRRKKEDIERRIKDNARNKRVFSYKYKGTQKEVDSKIIEIALKIVELRRKLQIEKSKKERERLNNQIKQLLAEQIEIEKQYKNKR